MAGAPGSLFDRRDDSIRGLLRVPATGEAALLEKVHEIQGKLDNSVSIGVSNVCSGARSFQAGFEEARHALVGAAVITGKPGVMTYEELGPYKYLLRMPVDSAVRLMNVGASTAASFSVAPRMAYPSGGGSTASIGRVNPRSRTAEALYVHPNTLRQRLRRIQELSGLDLRKDDWLLVEIAVKMVKLQAALGGGTERT